MNSDDYARTIIEVGRRRGVSDRGICIALATALVETGSPQRGPNNMKMYANPKVPESLKLPHDAVGNDGYSVGLFQQQIRKGSNGQWWWADCATCMNPALSAGLFYDRLQKLPIDYTQRTPGSLAQQVQQSAYPDRYDVRFLDAQDILARLSGAPMPDYGITDTIFGYNAGSAGTGNSNGPRRATNYGAVHTQEGGNGDAIGLAKFCNGAQVAYNIEVDDERTVLNVPVIEGPWAAAEANDIAFHLCFAGSYAAWSRGRWLSADASDGLNEDAMLWRGAKAMAAASAQFGFPAVYAGSNGAQGWPPLAKGIVGHRDFGARGGGHHDPGNGFPMDVFVSRVQSFLRPTPVVNLIDEAAKANTWIGERKTKGENTCPDGKGKWAEFANAHIYWAPPANHAYAIPHGGLFEAWSLYGFEKGVLGYPVLPFAKVAGGASQSFQGGVLLRQDNRPRGYYVHGEIGKKYAAMRWEQGALGWPTSDEQRVPDTDNIVQHFEHGSLRWSPTGVIVDLEKK